MTACSESTLQEVSSTATNALVEIFSTLDDALTTMEPSIDGTIESATFPLEGRETDESATHTS